MDPTGAGPSSAQPDMPQCYPVTLDQHWYPELQGPQAEPLHSCSGSLCSCSCRIPHMELYPSPQPAKPLSEPLLREAPIWAQLKGLVVLGPVLHWPSARDGWGLSLCYLLAGLLCSWWGEEVGEKERHGVRRQTRSHSAF